MSLPSDLLELARATPRAVIDQQWAERCARYREVRDATSAPDDMSGGICHRVGGFWWYLPRPDVGLDREIARSSRRRAMFEIHQSRRLGAVGHTMIDIGAALGTTSIPRVKLGHFRRAFVAEPAPLDFTFLVRNIIANKVQGLVLPDDCAIFSESGSVNLLVRSQSGVHRISHTKPGRLVSCFTLDDWLERCGTDVRHVHFVKCDAQGAEGNVLAGAQSLLAARRAVWQLEYWPRGLAALGTSETDLQDTLQHWFTDFIALGRRGDDTADESVRPISRIGQALADLDLGPRGFINLLLYPTALAAIRGTSG